MSGTKKRRFKLFSRKRKKKEQRLQQQQQFYKEKLQEKQADRYRVDPGDYKSGGKDYFKNGLTIKPLILEGDTDLENLEYVKTVTLPKDAFPVFEADLKKFKEEFKKYEKTSKSLEKLQKKSSTGNDSSKKQSNLPGEIESLEKQQKSSKQTLTDLGKLILLTHHPEFFLNAKYRAKLTKIGLEVGEEYSTWWGKEKSKKLLHYAECKTYNETITKCVNAVTASAVTPADQGTLRDSEKKVRKLLLDVDTILESAGNLLTRFGSLSAKTRVLGKKTFYGTGYQEVKASVEPLVTFEKDLTGLLGHILLARSGMIHVSGYSYEKTETHGSSALLSIVSLVEDYNRQVDGLFALMCSRKVITENEFKELLENTKKKLTEINENCIPEESKVENNRALFGHHVMNLKQKVDKMDSCIKTLQSILTYYQTLESNLKQSALGRVLLLKERYGHYLDAIQTLCNSLPKVV